MKVKRAVIEEVEVVVSTEDLGDIVADVSAHYDGSIIEHADNVECWEGDMTLAWVASMEEVAPEVKVYNVVLELPRRKDKKETGTE